METSWAYVVMEQNNSIGIIDQLDYIYYPNSNRLKAVSDVADEEGFKDGGHLEDYDYLYDVNGNMVEDLNKGITNIEYNHLNLPKSITFENIPTELESNKIEYVYDASGVKLQKRVSHYHSGDRVNNTITDYDGGFIYKEEQNYQMLNGYLTGNEIGLGLQFFAHAEGYFEPTETTPSGELRGAYVYQYKDHTSTMLSAGLGNIRLSYKEDRGNLEIVEENNYYPFGLKHKGYNNVVNGTENNHFDFQGQEIEKELGLNWIEFKWRSYNPEIARFMTIDPLAEEFTYNSPYNFAENRVIDGVELEGLEWQNFRSKFKKTSKRKIKPVPTGKGVQNQSYSVVSLNPKKSLEELRSTFKDEPQEVLSNSKATFRPIDKEGNNLENANLDIGSDIEIDIIGPMNNSAVRVVGMESDEDSFSYTFATLEGHVEAGEITFMATQDEDGNITFSINSVSKVDFGMLPESFARNQQSKSWQEVLTNIINYLGGTESDRRTEIKE